MHLYRTVLCFALAAGLSLGFLPGVTEAADAQQDDELLKAEQDMLDAAKKADDSAAAADASAKQAAAAAQDAKDAAADAASASTSATASADGDSYSGGSTLRDIMKQRADARGVVETPAVADEDDTAGGDAADMKKAKKQKKSKKAKKVKERFVEILQDDSYIYSMDTASAKWIPMPKSGGERIIDVWIRLVDKGMGDGSKSYSYPQKYFLEHYYIRPLTQQIQFLCELEVTGRPQNTIQQRAYSSENWEDLVPESVEDAIYRAVVQRMKKADKSHGLWPQGMSVKDALDEYLRIAI